MAIVITVSDLPYLLPVIWRISLSESLRSFRERLTKKLDNPHARPFVCRSSPFSCKTFIVGINAATSLAPFTEYWNDEIGFLWEKFKSDYKATGKREGNRRPIEVISQGCGGALETNVCMRPSKRARELTEDDWDRSILPFLFSECRPNVVFVHATRPITYFKDATGLQQIDMTPRRAEWMGHPFWICGRPGPLYTLSTPEAFAFGERLRKLSPA